MHPGVSEQSHVWTLSEVAALLDRGRIRAKTIPVEEVRKVASTWRKSKGSDTWHFCSNCRNWPTSNYDISYTKPASGELCNECQAKRNRSDCD